MENSSKLQLSLMGRRLLMQLERFAHNFLDEEQSLRALEQLAGYLDILQAFRVHCAEDSKKFHLLLLALHQIDLYIQMEEIRISCAPTSYYKHF